jgi:hypothetical protein
MKRGRAKRVCWLKESKKKARKGRENSDVKPARWSERELSDLFEQE